MVVHADALYQNRKHAAYLLGERLMEHRDSDAIVVAIPGGGIHMGSYLAQLLRLPLEVIPCKKIKHPAEPAKTIGAVSINAVVLREVGNEIPQDYIYHQIQLLQHVIQGQNRSYHGGRLQASLEKKTIILVDDMLKTGDTMLACLRSIRKQAPEKIIVAVPNVTPDATRSIAAEIDAIIYLTIEPVQAVDSLYAELPDVSEEEVKSVLHQLRESQTQLK